MIAFCKFHNDKYMSNLVEVDLELSNTSEFAGKNSVKCVSDLDVLIASVNDLLNF